MAFHPWLLPGGLVTLYFSSYAQSISRFATLSVAPMNDGFLLHWAVPQVFLFVGGKELGGLEEVNPHEHKELFLQLYLEVKTIRIPKPIWMSHKTPKSTFLANFNREETMRVKNGQGGLGI